MNALSSARHNTKQLFIIDKNVDGWRDLVNNAGIGVSVLLLAPSQNGLTQITNAITAYSNLDAIHILSHGNVASLQLGSATLNSSNLNLYTKQLTAIGNALSENGDLLLYGCDVAQGETGQQFIQALAQITGADVAASNDLTGNAALGGDSVLEVSTGSIEANSYNLQSYQGVLRDYSLDYLLAEISNLVYDNNPSAPADWIPDDSSIQSSGFAAFSFKNGNDIVIAYRGTKLTDLGDLAADVAIANPLADWHQQFTDALNFAWKIKDANKDNPNIKIYVTGHSLGGALAQVASQMFGFDGATFDPGGARNLTQSADFVKWANDLKQNHPELTLNQGVGAGFLNYLVADSLVSGLIPDHIGSNEQLDFFAYAANEKLVIGMATELASYALADYKLGFLADAVSGLLTAYALHQMDGIVTLMSIKKYNQITADFQQKIEQSLQTASTTGDIGFISSTSNQGQTEFHSSKEHPYLFANDLDNIIYGYAGNDAIYSLAGNDTVYGGDGNDTISTAQDNDVIDAGLGNDTIYAGSGDDTISRVANNGENAVISGGAGTDKLSVDFSGNGNGALFWRGYDASGTATSANWVGFNDSMTTIQAALNNAVKFKLMAGGLSLWRDL